MNSTFDDGTREVIGAMIEVHRALGPGLLESAYDQCLCIELGARGLRVERQRPIALVYRDVVVEGVYRLDFVVNETIAIELKAIDMLLPVHEAQLVTYLRLTGLPVGLLVNFNVPVLKSGLRRLTRESPRLRTT